VTVEANGTGTVEVTARYVGEPETVAYLDDRGQAAALKFAESAQSPVARGNVLIRLWI
jgi:hypothetical protein